MHIRGIDSRTRRDGGESHSAGAVASASGCAEAAGRGANRTLTSKLGFMQSRSQDKSHSTQENGRAEGPGIRETLPLRGTPPLFPCCSRRDDGTQPSGALGGRK